MAVKNAAPTELGTNCSVFYKYVAPTALRREVLGLSNCDIAPHVSGETSETTRETRVLPHTFTHFPDFTDSSTAASTI
jgi:hypothetical protein